MASDRDRFGIDFADDAHFLTAFLSVDGQTTGPRMGTPFISGAAAWLNNLTGDDRRGLATALCAPTDAAIPSDALTPPPEHQPEGEPVDDAHLNEIRQGFGRPGIQTFTGGQTAGEGIWVTVLGTPKQFRHLLAPDGGALTPQQVEWVMGVVGDKLNYTTLGPMGKLEIAKWIREALDRLTHSTSDANTGEEGEHG